MWSKLEIMIRARVEFLQEDNLQREGEREWPKKRITVEWKQLEGEGVGVDGRHKAEPRALALLCLVALLCLACLACLERRGEEPIH